MFSRHYLEDDVALKQWFTDEEVHIMKEAVEDHRASNKHEPRSIYGKIVSEADRQIDVNVILERTLQYSLFNYPSYTLKEHSDRAYAHIRDKYGVNGYLNFWIKTKKNSSRIIDVRKLVSNRELFDERFLGLYNKSKGEKAND